MINILLLRLQSALWHCPAAGCRRLIGSAGWLASLTIAYAASFAGEHSRSAQPWVLSAAAASVQPARETDQPAAATEACVSVRLTAAGSGVRLWLLPAAEGSPGAKSSLAAPASEPASLAPGSAAAAASESQAAGFPTPEPTNPLQAALQMLQGGRTALQGGRAALAGADAAAALSVADLYEQPKHASAHDGSRASSLSGLSAVSDAAAEALEHMVERNTDAGGVGDSSASSASSSSSNSSRSSSTPSSSSDSSTDSRESAPREDWVADLPSVPLRHEPAPTSQPQSASSAGAAVGTASLATANPAAAQASLQEDISYSELTAQVAAAAGAFGGDGSDSSDSDALLGAAKTAAAEQRRPGNERGKSAPDAASPGRQRQIAHYLQSQGLGDALSDADGSSSESEVRYMSELSASALSWSCHQSTHHMCGIRWASGRTAPAWPAAASRGRVCSLQRSRFRQVPTRVKCATIPQAESEVVSGGCASPGPARSTARGARPAGTSGAGPRSGGGRGTGCCGGR